jgi:hypothetical protein
MNNIIKCTFLTVTVAILAACGGGGSSSGGDPPASRTAVLKLSTTGTPSAQLAGIDITVTLPDGVTASVGSDGSVAASADSVSGVAAPGTILAPVYTQASGATKGTLRLVLASEIAAGFGAGEFATVTLVVAAGANPVPSDFLLSGLHAVDVNGNSATGLTAAVADLAIR